MRFDNDSMTGMLAPTPEPFEPQLGICWPSDISAERKAAILANPHFLRYLSGQPPREQMRQIYLWSPPVDPAAEARQQAEKEAARDRRAAELAALPTHEELCNLVRSLEAKVIEQSVRIAELEAKKQPKSKVIGRIASANHSTPPDAA
jgi:hypothetical protein